MCLGTRGEKVVDAVVDLARGSREEVATADVAGGALVRDVLIRRPTAVELEARDEAVMSALPCGAGAGHGRSPPRTLP